MIGRKTERRIQSQSISEPGWLDMQSVCHEWQPDLVLTHAERMSHPGLQLPGRYALSTSPLSDEHKERESSL